MTNASKLLVSSSQALITWRVNLWKNSASFSLEKSLCGARSVTEWTWKSLSRDTTLWTLQEKEKKANSYICEARACIYENKNMQQWLIHNSSYHSLLFFYWPTIDSFSYCSAKRQQKNWSLSLKVTMHEFGLSVAISTHHPSTIGPSIPGRTLNMPLRINSTNSRVWQRVSLMVERKWGEKSWYKTEWLDSNIKSYIHVIPVTHL